MSAAEDDAHGPADEGRDDEVRGAPRIPGPRAAADDLDLCSLLLPPPAPTASPPERESAVPPIDPPAPQSPSAPHTPPVPASPSAPHTPPVPQGPPEAPALLLPHRVLKALLGAWALAACSAEETDAVEAHLTECAACADEALRLRDAVGLLQTDRSLDLDPALRSRVIDTCLSRRPAAIPVPDWPPRTTRRPPGSTRCCTTSAARSGTPRCG